MKKALFAVLFALVIFSLFAESDGWWRRRRRRYNACNWNRWTSWSFRCSSRCSRGTAYRYRYGYGGYPYCYYRGWQRQSLYCGGAGCQQLCYSGTCRCRGGYRSSGRSCYDIDECSSNGGRGPCQTSCHNRIGSYYCSCNSGYYVCSTTRCCPVNCGRPRVPTSCPSSTFRDTQSLTPCKPLPYQSHCSTVYPNACNLKCPTYYSIATYNAGGTFFGSWASTSVIGKNYNVRCQASARWTAASTISRFYCRRDNDPPQRVTLSSTTINEHSPVGSTVGYLSTYDPNRFDTHIFTVRPSSAAIFFNVIGNRLVVTFVPKFNHHQGITGDGNSFTITLRVTDRGTPAMYKDQAFTIRILDANEPPERLMLSNTVVSENAAVGSTIGYFTAYDPDTPTISNPCTWTITGLKSGFFSTSSNKLMVAKSLNFEAQNNHPLQISCTDFGRPVATTTETFIIDVRDAQEPPITLTLSNAQVDEDARAGHVVGVLTAIDQDKETLKIEMLGGQVPITAVGAATTRFSISPAVCQVLPQKDLVKARTLCTANLLVAPRVRNAAAGTAGALDFETGGWFQLVFFARDASHPSLHKSLYANVSVNDVNEAPTAISIANLSIPETAPGGALVSSLVVTDPDNTQRIVQRPTCTLVPGGDDAYFSITGESPNLALELALTTRLDFEVKPTYSISVTCNDHGLPPLSLTRSFVVMVIDENEAPLNITLSNNMVKENVPVGTTVGTFKTLDPDVGNTFTYNFATGFSTVTPFAIRGGQLVTTGKLDYESNDSYVIDVSSTDQGGLEAIETFVIWVQDVPEAPTNLALDGNHTVPENSTAGLLIGNMIITDEDENQDPSCLVSGGRDMQYFATAGDSGLALVTTSSASMLNYELMGADKSLQVEVTCKDLDGLGIKKTFTITVTNVNEPPTDITLLTATVNENAPAGTLIGTLSVTDVDVGQGHNCSVIDTQPQAGQVSPLTQFYVKNMMLYTKTPLDYEAEDVYSVEIECSDMPMDGQPSIAYDKPILVQLVDVNEVPGSPCAYFAVGENKPNGTSFATLNSTDPDNEHSDKQVLSYAVVNSVPFRIDPLTSEFIKSGPLNHEKKANYSVQIQVTDDGNIQTSATTFKKVAPLSMTYTCIVHVLDENDPHVSASIRLVPTNASVNEGAKLGTVIARVVTDDVDANAKHTYMVTNTGVPFTMVGDNLTVTAGGQNIDYESSHAAIPVTISSTDEHGHSVSRLFGININDFNEHPTALCIQGSSIDENQPAGHKIGQLVVEDPDYPQRSCNPIQAHTELPVDDTCEIVDNTADQIYKSRFAITKTLVLQQKVPLNYEDHRFYDLQIVCRDSKQPLNIISKTFTITVINKNEKPYNLTVDTTAWTNMQYARVSASLFEVFIPEHVYNMPVLDFGVMDPDTGAKQALVTYSVSGANSDGVFEMRLNQLYLLKPLDHEGTTQYTLRVIAQDPQALTVSVNVKVNITDMPDKPSQVHLECSGGALFDLWSAKSRTRRQATNATAPLPTLPATQTHTGIWGSSEDCSILADSMIQSGYLIGKIFPQDQDSFKWYNFTLSGMHADMFELAPYGATQGNMWQAAWLRLSKTAGATAQSRFDFTRWSPVYTLRVDVVDQWGMHELGQYLNVTTRDACYLGRKFCSAVANCSLSMGSASGYSCVCPMHNIGDGLSGSTGCVACSPGDSVMNGKCVTVDECLSNPCTNGGSCIDGIHAYTCACTAAYTGDQCEIHQKTCALQPGICLNGGVCKDTKDDILCQCTTGYSGYYCELQDAACANFPAQCDDKATSSFCAATPAINGMSSIGICTSSDQAIHVIIESTCVPTSGLLDATYVHRATQYLEEVLNNPEMHADQDFCQYHTQQAQPDGGVVVAGRKKRATSLTSRQYVVQTKQSIFLRKGVAMHTAIVLNAALGFSPLTQSDVCAKLSSAKYLRCLMWSDCHNSTALAASGFKCGKGKYTATLTDQISPQKYIELYVPDPFVTDPPCLPKDCANIIKKDPNQAAPQEQRHSPSAAKPFYETTPGIVIIVAASVAFVVVVCIVIACNMSKRKIKGRYDERLLHTTYDGASASGSQVSLGGDAWKQRFVDGPGVGASTAGVTNPMYEVAGGNVQHSSGVVECENALYESPDQIREMNEDMDN